MLTTDIERKENTTIVRCVGRIVVGDELSKLRDAVLCELDKQAILLDLRGVEAIDAGGLGLLLFLHTCAHGLGTELKLGARSARVEDVLRLTKLHSVLSLCSDGEMESYFAPQFGGRTVGDRLGEVKSCRLVEGGLLRDIWPRLRNPPHSPSLRTNGFCLFGKQNRGTFHDPAHVETLSLGGLRFFGHSDRWIGSLKKN
jgi:anti-anti-sigma factor